MGYIALIIMPQHAIYRNLLNSGLDGMSFAMNKLKALVEVVAF